MKEIIGGTLEKVKRNRKHITTVGIIGSAIAAVKILAVVVSLLIVSNPAATEAASNNVWTTKADWQSGTLTNLDATTSDGNLLLTYIPGPLVVANAGTTAVNGTYTYNSGISGWQLGTSYVIQFVGGAYNGWFLCQQNVGGTCEVGALYYVNASSSSETPTTTWNTTGYGSDPAPTVTQNAGSYAASGTDVIQYNSGTTDTTWDSISWNATTPANTLIKARIRAANTQAGLSSATYSDYVTTSGSSVSSVTGQWAEIEWYLGTTDASTTPTLADGTVAFTKTDNSSKTWTTKTDWDSGTKSQVDSALSDGNLSLQIDAITIYTVSGAGDTAYNATYSQSGTYGSNSKPAYTDGTHWIFNDYDNNNGTGDVWCMATSKFDITDPYNQCVYISNSQNLPGSWWTINGANPVPTVAAAGGTHLTPGTDVFQYDSVTTDTTWDSISWNATTPASTLIKARVRAANTQAGLSSATYSNYVTTSGGTVTGVTGRWAEIEWRLETTDVNATPILADGTLEYTLGNSGSATWTTKADWETGTRTTFDTTTTEGSGVLHAASGSGFIVASAGDSNYNGTFVVSGTYGSSNKPAYTYNSRWLFSDYADMYGQDSWCLATSKQDLWDPYMQCDYYSTDANLPGTTWYATNGAPPAPSLTASIGAYDTSGTDAVQYNSGTEDTTWNSISWNGTTPTNTLIKARVRAANTQAGLSSATYSDYITSSGGTLTGISGQWAEIEWRLETTDTAVTPTLDDGTITYTYPASATVPDAPTIGTATAGDAQASVAFSAPASDGGSAITGYTVTSTPGSLTGTGASSPITVTGLTNGTAYTFTVHATNSVGNSSESSASNQVTPAVPGITVSGTCKQYDESTNCADSETVKIAVNGNLQAQTGTTSGGSWSISGITTPSASDTLTVFVDGTADANRANAVTKYSGTGDVTTMVLYERHLVLGDGSQTLSNADIAKYDGSVSTDNDIYFDVDASNNLTMPYGTTAQTDQKLFVLANNTWQPASSGAVTSTIPKLVIPTSATVTANANTIKLTGATDPITVAGTFNYNTSTVEIAGTTAQNISEVLNLYSLSFYNLKISNTSAAVSQAGAVTVFSTLTINSNAIYDVSGYALSAVTLSNLGTFRLTGGESTSLVIMTRDTTHGTVEYNGTGTYTSLLYGNAYNNLTISGSGTFTQNANATVAGAYSISAGTHSTGGYTLTTASTTISGGTLRIPNASFATKMTTSSFNQSGGTFNIGDYAYLDCNGTFTRSSGTTTVGSGSRFYISGDFVVSGANFGNSTTVLYLDGNTNAAVTTVPTVIGAIFRVAKGAAYTLTFNADPTFANFYVDSGNITTTGRTITMGTDGGTFGGGSQTINNLVINANPVYLASSATIDGTLVINSGKALTNNTAANLTMTDAARLTLNGTATLGANSSGTGYYIFKDDSATNIPTGGTIAGKVRLQTDTKDISIPARTYQSRLEVYNEGSSNRTATLGTAGSQTVTIGGHGYDNSWGAGLFLTANGNGNITLDASTYNPTVTILTGLATYTTGDIDFTGSGSGSESITAGSGTWTLKGDIDLTGGSLTAGSSTFVLNGATSQPQTITSAGNSFNNLTVQNTATNGTIFADNSSVTGTFTDTTNDSKLNFTGSTTHNWNAINIHGSSGHLVTLNSTNSTAWTINPTTVVDVSYDSIAYSTNTGATFCATYSTDAGNNTGWQISSGATCSTVPNAPTDVSGTRGNGQVSVAFTAPSSDGGSAITGYTVTSTPGSFTATGTSSPIIVTGLTNGTAYTFTVHATNANGNSSESTASASVTPATNPGAPTSVVGTRGNGQVSVAFTAPASNGGDAITGYTVTSTPGNFTASGSSSPIVVTGLTNGTAYTFTVHATNTVGSSSESSASSSVTPATTPGAPTSVSATRGNTQATVSFTAPASNGGDAITGYTVTSTPGNFTASGAGSPLTVTGLTNGVNYSFTVHATNSVGNSTESSASNIITPATTPGAPTSITATAGSGQMSISFTAPISNGGDAITDYTVTSTPGSFSANGISSPLTVTGLSTNVAYTFTVRATNTVGNSSESSASAAKYTLANTPTISVVPGYDGTSGYHLDATIGANGNPAGTNYWLQYSTDGTNYSNPSGMAWQTGTTYILANLSANTQYYLKVEAKNGDGITTSYSSAASAVTPPAAPATLNSSNVCRDVALLSWTASTGANKYTVSYGTDTAATNLGTIADLTSTSKQMSSLTNNTTYYWKVSATSNSNGTGGYSSISNFATATCTASVAPGDFAGTTVSSSQINWSWTDTADDETGWRVKDQLNDNISAALAAGTTSWNETGLSPNTAYTRKVNVYNANGNNDSNLSTVYTLSNVPSAPTLAAASTNAIKITVNANSNPTATRYAIYNETLGKYVRKSDGGFQDTEDWQLYNDWGGASGFSNVGLTAGTSYSYKVKAENGDGVATDFSTGANTKTSNPTIQFTSASASGSVNSVSSYNLPISISEISGQAITVDYSVSGGTATSGVDYTLASGTATINAGQTSAIVNLAILNSHLVGADKTVVISLSNPNNTSIGANSSFTYTITNDNVAPSGGLIINNNATKTNSRDLSIAIAYQIANQMIISTSADFAGANYQAAANFLTYQLPDLDGVYTVYMKLKDQYGNESSSYSKSITLDRVAPVVPTNLAAQAGNSAISLSWTNPSDSDLSFIRVYRGDSADFAIADANKTFDVYSGGATYVDSEVINNHNYFYKVAASDDIGNISGVSNEVTARADSDNPTTPGKPTTTETLTNVDGKQITTSKKITFNWTASTDENSGLASYAISIGSTSGASDILDNKDVAADTLSYQHEFAKDGNYFVRIIAKDKTGNLSSYTDELVFSIDSTAPSDPSDVLMYDISDRSNNIYAAAVSWKTSTDEISGIKGYVVSRDGTAITATDGISTVISDEKTGRSFFYEILSANANASYSVKAIDKIANESGQISAKLADTELVKTLGQTAGSSTLTLVSNIIGEGQLAISDIAVTPSDVVGEKTQAKVTWKTSVPATSMANYGVNAEYDRKTDLDTGLNSSHTIILSDLNPATTYHFKVISKDKSGNEVVSGDQTFTSGNPIKSDSILDTIIQTLSNTFSKIWQSISNLFSGVKVSAADASATEISTISVTNISTSSQPGYAIFWPKNKGTVSVQRSDGGDFTTIATTDQNFYLDFSASANGNYSYKISDLVGTTSDALSGKSTISNIKIESGSVSKDNASVIVTYQTDKLAQSQVSYGESGSLSNQTDLDQSLNQSHTILIENLKPKTTYSFKLRAIDKAGKEITDSEIQTFATPNAEAEQTILEVIIKALENAFSGFNKFMKG